MSICIVRADIAISCFFLEVFILVLGIIVNIIYLCKGIHL